MTLSGDGAEDGYPGPVGAQIPSRDLGFFVGGEAMEKRLGGVGIVIEDRKAMAPEPTKS
jgi:hypothetical protein